MLTVGAVLSATALLAGVVQAAAAPAQAGVPSAAQQHDALLALAEAQAAPVAGALALGDRERLVVKDVVTDADGTRHLRYDRTFAGLPVIGGDLVVHQRADGSIASVDRAFAGRLSLPSLAPKLSADRAAAGAADAVRATLGASTAQEGAALAQVGSAGEAQLVVWAGGDTPRLAYRTVVQGVRTDGVPSSRRVITDAGTGAVLASDDAVRTATGTGTGVNVGAVTLTTTQSGATYQLKDATRGNQSTVDGGVPGNPLFTSTTNSWGNGFASNRQSAAVDAQFDAAVTWDYFKNTFGRNGIRNNGVGITSRVHVGNGLMDLFWDDTCYCMSYGDGRSNSKPMTELDVAAHEMSHGITAVTAGLPYSGEPGGLDEATSDILGTMVEWYASLQADPPDYLIAEKLDFMGNGTPLRYMDEPSKDGYSRDFWYSGIGALDPHFSSGVGNHFFYLLSEGSGAKVVNGVAYNSPTADGSTLVGIGRDKAAAIWYRALTIYFTSTTNYRTARNATVAAARDLYGQPEVNAVAAAWKAVNVN
ncbi:M4 family metallopeptidase [Kitasatospora sp. CB01950]|uniref:M4 family metallopeptidase n=1 Tax=Kitasatospora sp. CB01950 TaxID=1703930 RepID=UPI0009391D0F|nr:M4 family metallopeptidase [Kitasatospora sp. CB01950]OKJ05569.1 peptidase [Kitasatospora sp. CB01950]